MIELKMSVLIFSTNLSEIFLILTKIKRENYHKCTAGLHVIFSDFNKI